MAALTYIDQHVNGHTQDFSKGDYESRCLRVSATLGYPLKGNQPGKHVHTFYSMHYEHAFTPSVNTNTNPGPTEEKILFEPLKNPCVQAWSWPAVHGQHTPCSQKKEGFVRTPSIPLCMHLTLLSKLAQMSVPRLPYRGTNSNHLAQVALYLQRESPPCPKDSPTLTDKPQFPK